MTEPFTQLLLNQHHTSYSAAPPIIAAGCDPDQWSGFTSGISIKLEWLSQSMSCQLRFSTDVALIWKHP